MTSWYLIWALDTKSMVVYPWGSCCEKVGKSELECDCLCQASLRVFWKTRSWRLATRRTSKARWCCPEKPQWAREAHPQPASYIKLLAVFHIFSFLPPIPEALILDRMEIRCTGGFWEDTSWERKWDRFKIQIDWIFHNWKWSNSFESCQSYC